LSQAIKTTTYNLITDYFIIFQTTNSTTLLH